MHTKSLKQWSHGHVFGQDRPKRGERLTLIVILLTAVTMVVEIVAGLIFGSMALLADGLHMASHTSALSIAAFAYYYTRRHAKDRRFNFGTGKVNSLAAFASAILLVIFAAVMAWKSINRFIVPVTIAFNQAILVAVLGLMVNGISLLILRHGGDYNQGQEKIPSADEHRDHTLWSAYLHVLADALTSFLAIFALLAGKHLGFVWLDPCMGIVGAVLVTCWSWGLIKASGHVLLDMEVPEPIRQRIRDHIEAQGDNRISDMHVWAVGPGILAAEIAVVSSEPKAPDQYWRLLPKDLDVVHLTVQVHHCPAHGKGPNGKADPHPDN